ncbi:hypothetical protein CN070_15290 [Sinorhizobium meliloti]|nr:hypothetical protein CN070_15290 [Sinorhizobium meliloti]
MVWLDSCDKHRNEEIKQAAAGGPNLDTPLERFQKFVLRSSFLCLHRNRASPSPWAGKDPFRPAGASLPSSR